MKRLFRPRTVPVVCLAFMAVACSSGGGTGNTGGTSGGTGGATSTGGTSATGGSSATGGATSTGGKTGTGGTGAASTGGSSTGGNASTGGSGGGGGSANTGGSAGTGGAGGSAPFSFFVTSMKAIIAKSGNANGFGGDLRFGETGQGAGLRGADKICAAIAEGAVPGAGKKPWRAFLSAAKGEDGNQVNAIDRIGTGPWYDRTGRLLAATKADLLHDRPAGGDATIANDFPNEDGVPNHAPVAGQGQVDNHDMLTGTDTQGKLYAATATCLDWTANKGDKTAEGRPRVGHSWPRAGGGAGPGGGSMNNWMSSLDEAGCAPGISIIEMGGPSPTATTVGDGGGYGGFYCFSLVP